MRCSRTWTQPWRPPRSERPDETGVLRTNGLLGTRMPDKSCAQRDAMMDRIELTGLTVRGNHGVFDFERRDGQDFIADVSLELDTRKAAASDEIVDTVHYGELAEALAAVIAGDPVNLLETLAERLATVCLADPRVQAATVTVHKPQAPIPLTFADVAVTIRRARSGGAT